MSRADDESRAAILAVIDDLRALVDMPTVDRVRRLGELLTNRSEPQSVRTRLAGARGLAAVDADDANKAAGGVPLPALLGVGSNNAYEMTALGRQLLSAPRNAE